MSEKNKAIIKRIREEAVGGSSAALDFLDGLYAADYQYHGGAFGEMQGPTAFKDLLNGMSAVLDGYRELVVHQVAEGDLVATRLEGKGRVVGELLGVPGNGREMRSTAFSLVRFNGRGEIAEEWVEADVYGMLRQLEG